ncbi:YciI family protein [Nostoc punctiforme]|nr:YciI family protein [Nostoc punctiforme]
MARCRFEQLRFDLLTKENNGGKPMKYVLLIYLEENALSETEREDCYVKSAQLAQQLNSNGQYLATAPLHPVTTATSVRVRDGKPLVTDGPFAETREQLGGFFLIDAQDIDAAIAIAAQIPAVEVGTVEIRPVIEVAGLPEH